MMRPYRSPLIAALLLVGLDSSASLLLPDAEFSFAASTLDAKESTAIIERAAAGTSNALLFKPSKGKGSCEESLVRSAPAEMDASLAMLTE